MQRTPFSAVVVAAGSGTRAGEAKQWRPLYGRPVLLWSTAALLEAGADEVVVVVAAREQAFAAECLNGLSNIRIVAGGAERADSVRNGLAAIDRSDGLVLVHDAARPLLTPQHVARLLGAIGPQDDGAIMALPLTDTVKRGFEGCSESTIDRENLWRAQTPQAFRLKALRHALEAAPDSAAVTDEAAAVELAGGRVRLVCGDPRLLKITYPEDFAMIEALARPSVRTVVGQGFDAHRWGPGDAVWLCGVRIPHDQALIGHSDADAGLHALTDAVLAAIGDGDIGDHFPPSDPRWRGVSSDRFLLHALERLRLRGGRMVHCDVTLICERPKVKPHRDAMRMRLAELTGLPVDAISLKATTTEGMGFTGRGEGLAAQAIATFELS